MIRPDDKKLVHQRFYTNFATANGRVIQIYAGNWSETSPVYYL